MEWKTAFSDEGRADCWWMKKLGAYFISGYPKANRYRITVEEEVSECCEKWRGETIRIPSPHIVCREDCPAYVYYDTRLAMFCPECGRKL